MNICGVSGRFVQHICTILLVSLMKHKVKEGSSEIGDRDVSRTRSTGTSSDADANDKMAESQVGEKRSSSASIPAATNNSKSGSGWQTTTPVSLQTGCVKCSRMQHCNMDTVKRKVEIDASVLKPKRASSSSSGNALKKGDLLPGRDLYASNHHRWKQKTDMKHDITGLHTSTNGSDMTISEQSGSVIQMENSHPPTEAGIMIGIPGSSLEHKHENVSHHDADSSGSTERNIENTLTDAFLSSVDLTWEDLSTLVINTKDEQQQLFCDLGKFVTEDISSKFDGL